LAYLSLYRKYRSQTFGEVIGQDHVTQTLVNAIDEGRLHHAWLFTGPRGTGKTSTARILAKAVNCEQGPTSTPCLTCDHCVAIADGSSIDVIELDMASHGGVDDARELRERAMFSPASARMKVYILDEVHMASPAAFNALLKLIEEPPGHVMFAMATTDPHKVLPTILSRVQRLDLRRIPAQLLADHIRDIVTREGATIDDGALEGIVRAGDGSARDALSVLEQVLAYAGGKVTVDDVRTVLGVSAVQHAIDAVDQVLAGDVAAVLGLVHDLTESGQDLRRFTLDLVAHVRDLLAAHAAPDHPELIDATDEHRALVVEQAGRCEQASLLRMLGILGEVLTQQRQVAPRLPLELALARLAVPGADGDVAALADRLARLEAGGESAPAAGSGHADGTGTAAARPAKKRKAAARTGKSKAQKKARDADDGPAPAEAPASDASVDATLERVEAVDATLERVEAAWDSVLDSVKSASKRVYAVFEPATPVRLRDGILTLRYGRRHASFHAERARDSGYADVLRDAINELVSIRVRVDTEVEGDPAPAPRPPTVDEAGFSDTDETDEPDEHTRTAVDEAESVTIDPDKAQAQAEALLVSELGATPVE